MPSSLTLEQPPRYRAASLKQVWLGRWQSLLTLRAVRAIRPVAAAPLAPATPARRPGA